MNKVLISIFVFIINCAGLVGQTYEFRINDGPYIFKREKKTIIKWIENGYVRQKNLDQKTFESVKTIFNLDISFRDINTAFNLRPEYRFAFRGIDSIAVISDIHGSFNKYLDLLRAQGIVDNTNRWKFGKGHLVILGDCFDRGDKVTELLWHIFSLEKQADKAGGRVHMMLGNHEIMVFGEDLRYMNDKYRKVEYLTGIPYPDLYSNESLLGRWLRNKPVIITLNNIVFVHGGISTEMIRENLGINDINRLFYQLHVMNAVESDNDIVKLSFLTGDHGPVWYRGYFYDPDFTEAKADSVLNYFGKDHIIVGHTHSEGFQSLFDNKILGIDAGIGSDLEGALLIVKDGVFYYGTPDGKRREL